MLSVDDYMRLPLVEPDLRYAYGSDELQQAHLYLPAGVGPHPVVAMLHGGCWRAPYGPEPLGLFCRDLAQAGLAVWNIDYRRNDNGGGWPQTFLDVAQGLDALRSVAAQYALDLQRVVLAGHSAGGTLACWAAARHKLPPSSPLYTPDPLAVLHVICLAGIVDLAQAEANRICLDDLPTLMGGTLAQVPERYQQASPQALLPLGVPLTYLIGAEDTGILANAQPCVDAARAAGDAVEWIVLPDASHFEVVTPGTAAWPAVHAAICRAAGL